MDVRNTSLDKELKWLEREQREERNVPVLSLQKTMRTCQQHWEKNREESKGREGKRSWGTTVADEGQGVSQKETTCDGGVVEMRMGWWGDESKDVGGERAETICF